MVIFVAKYVTAMVFGGGILGGARYGQSLLKSTTVLFDLIQGGNRYQVHLSNYHH